MGLAAVRCLLNGALELGLGFFQPVAGEIGLAELDPPVRCRGVRLQSLPVGGERGVEIRQRRLDVAGALVNDASLSPVGFVIQPLRPGEPAGFFKDAQRVLGPPRPRHQVGKVDSKNARLGKFVQAYPQYEFGFSAQSNLKQNVFHLHIRVLAQRRQREQLPDLGNRPIELPVPKLREADKR